MIPQSVPAAVSSTGAASPLPLRDIHLPPPPSWWPPAPGWWVLAAIVLVLVTALIAWRWRRGRSREHERRVLAELDRISAIEDEQRYAAAMHRWIRRAARRYAPQATHQQGEAWRQTLQAVAVDQATIDHLLSLEQAIYRPHAQIDRVALDAAVRRWGRLALRRAPVAAEPSTSLAPSGATHG